MISSAPTTSDHFVRRAKNVGIGRRRDEDYDLSLPGLLDDLMSKRSTREDEAQQRNVNDS
jgi:hypothetical protein